MSYIRIKRCKKGNNVYFYLQLCESIREGAKVYQKVIKHIGKVDGFKDLDSKVITEVFKRDNFQCTKCKNKKELSLVVLDSDLEKNAINIKLLCKSCINT